MKPKSHGVQFTALATLATSALLTCAAGACGQGTILFYNHVNGELITHVYLGGDAQLAGDGANDTPSGTQDWSGFTALVGSAYTAQLWAADGPNQPENSLHAVLPTTTFLTIAGGEGTLVNAGWVQLPGVPIGHSATITLRVWDNRGGTITSWGMAQAAGVALGQSPLFNSPPVTGFGAPGPPLTGLVSFNIYQVPEPSMLALAGLGGFSFWWIRRRLLGMRSGSGTICDGPRCHWRETLRAQFREGQMLILPCEQSESHYL